MSRSILDIKLLEERRFVRDGKENFRKVQKRWRIADPHGALKYMYIMSPNYNKRPEIMQMFNREGAR